MSTNSISENHKQAAAFIHASTFLKYFSACPVPVGKPRYFSSGYLAVAGGNTENEKAGQGAVN